MRYHIFIMYIFSMHKTSATFRYGRYKSKVRRINTLKISAIFTKYVNILEINLKKLIIKRHKPFLSEQWVSVKGDAVAVWLSKEWQKLKLYSKNCI